MTTDTPTPTPNVEATNVVPQERYRHWKPVFCQVCDVRAEAKTTTDTHTYFQCPNCKRAKWIAKPTDPPPIVSF